MYLPYSIEMWVIAVGNDKAVIGQFLEHLKLWNRRLQAGVRQGKAFRTGGRMSASVTDLGLRRCK